MPFCYRVIVRVPRRESSARRTPLARLRRARPTCHATRLPRAARHLARGRVTTRLPDLPCVVPFSSTLKEHHVPCVFGAVSVRLNDRMPSAAPWAPDEHSGTEMRRHFGRHSPTA